MEEMLREGEGREFLIERLHKWKDTRIQTTVLLHTANNQQIDIAKENNKSTTLVVSACVCARGA